MKNPFKFKKLKLACWNIIYVIDIDIIDNDLKLFFDDKLTKICEGSRNIGLSDVKNKLVSFFDSKK